MSAEAFAPRYLFMKTGRDNVLCSRPEGLKKVAVILLVVFSILVPFFVALAGIGRRYDAVPDQDLLWLSEALKLHRRAPLFYADHPGIFWTWSYWFKLKLSNYFPAIFGGSVPTNEFIHSGVASRIVFIARLEQGFVCSLVLASLWPLLVFISGSTSWAALSLAAVSGSSGMLLESVLVRNESTSILFLLGYIGLSLMSRRAAEAKRLSIAIALSAMSLISFLISMYCKTQILLLSFPAVFVLWLVLRLRSGDRGRVYLSSEVFSWLRSILIAAFGWILLTSNLGYLPHSPYGREGVILNISLWIYLFVFQAVVVAASLLPLKKFSLPLVTACVVAVSLLFSRYFSAPIWSATVFQTPSSLFGWRQSEGSLIWANLLEYSNSLSSGFGVLLLCALFGLTIFWVWGDILGRGLARVSLLVASLVSFWLVFVAVSVRYQHFYGIYISVLLAVVLCFAYRCWGGRISVATATFSEVVWGSMLFVTMGILFMASISNISKSKFYASYEFEDSLCFPQQMDRLMETTSVGTCGNFDLERHG